MRNISLGSRDGASSAMLCVIVVLLIHGCIAQQSTIRIAAPYPSGRLAVPFGQDYKTVYSLWTNFVAASGGIAIGNQVYNVQLVLVDSGDDTNTTTATTLYTNLMLGQYGRIDYVLLPYPDTLASVVAPIVYQYNTSMVMVAGSTLDDTLYQCDNQLLYPCSASNRRRFPRLWSPGPTGASFWNPLVLLARMQGAARLALVCDPAPGATSVCNGVTANLLNYNQTLATLVTLPADYATNNTLYWARHVVDTWRTTSVDYVIVTANDPLCSLINQYMTNISWVPRGIALSPCTSIPAYGVGAVAWDPSLQSEEYTSKPSQLVPMFLPTANLTSSQVYDAYFLKAFGRSSTPQGAVAMAMCISLHAALLIANTTDSSAVNQAMSQVHEPSFTGTLAFDNNGQGTNSMLALMEDASGHSYIVAPLSTATSSLPYPMPTLLYRYCVAHDVCGLHGACQTDGTCECTFGWTGPMCASAATASVNVGLVVGVVIAGLIVIAIPVVWKFSSNSRRVAKLLNNDKVATELAESVAAMEFESIAYLDNISKPSRIQSAFIKIVRNLQLYKAYMPATLFAARNEDDDEEDVEDDPSPAPQAPPAQKFSHHRGSKKETHHGHSGSRSSFQRQSVVPPSSSRSCSSKATSKKSTRSTLSDRSLHLRALNVSDTMVKKTGTVLFTTLRGFHGAISEKSPCDVTTAHAKFLDAVLDIAYETRGVPDTFVGDRVMVSYNTATPNAQHRTMACRAALRLTQRSSRWSEALPNAKIYCGIASGPTMCGNMGSATMKHYTIISPCVGFAWLLCRVADQYKASVVIPADMTSEVEYMFVVRLFIRTLLSHKYGAKPIAVAQVVSEKASTAPSDSDEWIYELAEGDASPLKSYNEMVRLIQQGNFTQAAALVLNRETLVNSANKEGNSATSRMVKTSLKDEDLAELSAVLATRDVPASAKVPLGLCF